jgi:hypothetical protein
VRAAKAAQPGCGGEAGGRVIAFCDATVADYLLARDSPARLQGSLHAVDDGISRRRHGGWMMKVCSELARGLRTARGDGARRA